MLRVVHVEASATGRSLVQGSPTECVCVLIKYNNIPLHLKGVGRTGPTKKQRKKEFVWVRNLASYFELRI